MQYQNLLGPFCYAFLVVMGLLILVPYLRGRSDLLSGWNFFLLGAMNFVGLAGLQAAYEPSHFRILAYSNRDYQLYMVGVVVFFTSLVLFYRFVKFPRRAAGYLLRKWPPATATTLFGMLILSIALAALSLKPPPIMGVAQIIAQTGNKAIVIAVVLAFAAWSRQKTNLLLFGVLVGVVVLTAVFAVMQGGGRRTILGIVMALPITFYCSTCGTARRSRTW